MWLPETLRNIAGNGTQRLHGIYKPLISLVTKEPDYLEEPKADERKPHKVNLMTFLEPLKMFKERDILCTLVFGGVIYTIWSTIVASTTSIFKERFDLTGLELGLIFLPSGK